MTTRTAVARRRSEFRGEFGSAGARRAVGHQVTLPVPGHAACGGCAAHRAGGAAVQKRLRAGPGSAVEGGGAGPSVPSP